MSADREKNHNMTQQDIALLMADAADEVEIGIAPTQALIRGGRRRKARRWAVAAATALVVAGSTGALALTGLPGGDGQRVTPAGQPSAEVSRDVLRPYRTTLARGVDEGSHWRVYVDVWPAPRDAAEAEGQLAAMWEYGEAPVDEDEGAELVGKTSYFVQRAYGGFASQGSVTLQASVPASDTQSGTDNETVAMPLDPADDDGPSRLVIGHVSPTTQRVTCAWKDGTTTKLTKAPANTEVAADEPAIRTAEGSPYGWFVCLAPQGTEYESAEVTD
ncbi:hypothetical protein [Streptomyces sp. T028]|uniref:hypothetical protein n=1 Tax=Streptomyces sp. T028 TaxID=3394379 RepID=UPI003A88B986